MKLMTGTVANILDAVGNTPIVRLNRVVPETQRANLYAKLEYLNPGGSVKDRPALQIIKDAEENGTLKPGGTIVEATSGNTGMGLAMVAAVRGYKTIFVMPDKMSDEKVKALRSCGARVVMTPTEVSPEDPRSYYSVARKLTEETPNAILANQYFNPSNPKAHELSTGPEIWEQTGGEIDVFITAMGTGGTITGIARYLKSKNPKIRIVGIDPVGSIYYDYFKTGKMVPAHSYKVEGFGEDFLPGTMDLSVIDDVVRVTDKECFLMTRALVRDEGIYCGGSSGGIVAGAIKWLENHDGDLNVVTIMCDSSARYLTKIFDDAWMREHGYLQPELEMRVGEMIERRRQDLLVAGPHDSVRQTVGLMKKHGISQLPVLEEGKLIGLITETDLLQSLVNEQVTPETHIENLVDMNFAIVEPNNSLSLLTQVFAQGKIAVVVDKGEVVGVVTKIDLIDTMTSLAS
ncbi:MAG: pyridoxal-5'-phosphate-dependent protein subunit beta [Myxococcales bacterium]|nr:pyridoxal-5'-phosphate-dependent protein subunit beta [Myxococcales bacterium]